MQGRTLSEIRTEELLHAVQRQRDEAERRIGRVCALLGARDDESAEDAAARVARELDDARDAIVDGPVERADLRASAERLERERDYWRQQMELAGPDIDRLTRERDAARATARRLNRRCQDYERALAERYPRCDDGKPRGSMMSRALLNAYATQLKAEADELRELAWSWCIEARCQWVEADYYGGQECGTCGYAPCACDQ